MFFYKYVHCIQCSELAPKLSIFFLQNTELCPLKSLKIGKALFFAVRRSRGSVPFLLTGSRSRNFFFKESGVGEFKESGVGKFKESESGVAKFFFKESGVGHFDRLRLFFYRLRLF